MNRQLNTTRIFALTFVAFAALHIQARPPLHSRLAAPAQQQKPAPKTAKVYVCPMHPDIKSTRKGKCPKCKMDLQPVREATESADKEGPVASVAVGEITTADVNTSTVTGNVSGPTKTLLIPDVEVLDQEGHTLHFYTDLIKAKTVAINFIFTNCTTICPPLAATFARVQKEMGEKVGKDVYFISISVDPLTDTPERLKAWGAKFNASAGWTFVTGSKPQMDKLLNALGASVARREDHSPTVIVGNDLKGVWTRTYGLARLSQMVGLIESVIEAKSDASQQ
jgi:cytochrome oxidase Cu insertion factor (SCO1/SenC/PrrC family)